MLFPKEFKPLPYHRRGTTSSPYTLLDYVPAVPVVRKTVLEAPSLTVCSGPSLPLFSHVVRVLDAASYLVFPVPHPRGPWGSTSPLTGPRVAQL